MRSRILLGVAVLIAVLPVRGAPAVERSAQAAASPLEENPLLRPPNLNGQPLEVAVGMHIFNIASIDEVAQQFQIEGFLIAHWTDPRLAYQPKDPGDIMRFLKPGEFWMPRLEMVNAAAPRDSYDTAIRVSPDGSVNYIERFKAVLSSKFQLHRFPFDSQKLAVIIHPFVSNARTLRFSIAGHRAWVSSEFDSYSSLAQWELEAVSPRVGTTRLYDGSELSEVVFEIGVKRRYRFYLWKVFLPLLLMVVLSWSVFWVEAHDLSNQVQIAVTTILTVIAFAFAISATMPRVPYLTYIDAFFLECYVFVFLAIVELMVVHVCHRSERQADLGLRIRRVSRWLVPSAFVLCNVIIAVNFLA